MSAPARPWLAAAAALCLATGCASSGGAPAPAPMHALYEAGDLAGAVRAFLADTSQARSERELYRAAIASATPGHEEHNRARALGLLTRLLTEHPDSNRATESLLIITLLEEEAALARSTARLQRELEQLKAIDLEDRP